MATEKKKVKRGDGIVRAVYASKMEDIIKI